MSSRAHNFLEGFIFMRKVLRGAVVAAAIAPAFMLAVGTASADSYGQAGNSVGSDGASVTYTVTGVDASGEAMYTTVKKMVGPDGVTTSGTATNTLD
ncbi:hypothetical protein ACFC4G_43710 [Streptomyces sp. NPDC056002]|uniref:hypothetical protein n=1 Tax=Streptomyces sp. NPDC056002 TaxID=3345675 RepID=UPI0035DF5FD2